MGVDDNRNGRSGMQTAANLARAVKSAYNIIRAAAVSGIYGAVAAAAKEALPFLVKLSVGFLIVFILVPVLTISAIPNIFFGYQSSDSEPVSDMTEKAMHIGGAYMSVEAFEQSHIDAIVTSIVDSYENSGTTIDRIEVNSQINEDDLLWLIAINSVACEQNLDAMSTESIRSFCVSKLSYSPSLDILNGSSDTVTTLKVEIKHLKPDEIMEDLGFDETAKTWAGALYEMLYESNAIEVYGAYYDAYAPTYGGGGPHSGNIQHGTDFDNEIGISGFTDSDSKNNYPEVE